MGKKNRLNVLMMVSWYGPKADKLSGGSFHYEQARSLNKFCNCAIYYPYDRTLNEPVYSGIDWGIQTYRSKYALEKKFRNRMYMVKAMKVIVKEFRPDIIHGNVATEAGRFAVMLGKLFHIPVIISEHSAVEASGVRAFPHHMYADFAYRFSEYNTCVSGRLTEQLREIFPRYRFHTIYNGIPAAFSYKSNGEEKKLYRDNSKINAAIVAGYYDKDIKGLQFLLPAIKRIVDEGEEICFHFVGGGEYLDYYKNMAVELEIENSCIFYGNRDKKEVYHIVSEMDFMISASIFESFGCSIAEGMMLGKPAVATRCGGLESIVNEKTGILVGTKSSDELYSGIKQMIKRYPDFSEKELQEYALNKFEVDHISKQYMKVYERIISKKGKYLENQNGE